MERIDILNNAKEKGFFSNAPFYRTHSRIISFMVKDGLLEKSTVGDLARFDITEKGKQYIEAGDSVTSISSFDVDAFNEGKRGPALLSAMIREGLVVINVTEKGKKAGLKPTNK